VVLFGSVARNEAEEYSDLDLIIVISDGEAREAILADVARLEILYHMAIEPVILSGADLLDNLRSSGAGIAYGLAEGFQVLVDKTGGLGRVLLERTREIRRSHVFLEEERLWVRAE